MKNRETCSRRSFLTAGGSLLASGAFPFSLTGQTVPKPFGNIPAYWKDALPGIAEKVNARAAETVDGFWFITDLHIGSNRRQSGAVLAALAGMTPLRRTFCGGDLTEAFAARSRSCKAAVEDAVDGYRRFWQTPLEAAGMDLYTAKGNHDFTIRRDSKSPEGFTYSGQEARKVLMGSRACVNVTTSSTDPDACYYYFDQTSSKIRYVVADTTDTVDPHKPFWAVLTGMHERQLRWLAEKALGTLPPQWCAVLVHHIPMTGCVGSDGDAAVFTPFRKLCEAYQNRRRVALFGKTFDFTSAQGRILMSITGHHHAERQTFQNGILHVTEPCDAAYGDYQLGSAPWCGTLPRKEAGYIYEQTFDAVQLDPANDLVYFTRVGGGQDRVIHTKAREVKRNDVLRLRAAHLQGPVTWGCYDADRITYRPNPKNKYNSFVVYSETRGSVSADGTEARRPGELMVLAMDAARNKEIFPITVI